MDAVSLASSIITFLDLASKILVRTKDYLNNANDAPENIRSIVVQLPLLARSFEAVSQQARSRRLAPDVASELVKLVNNALSELKLLHHYVSMLKTDKTTSRLQKFDRAIKSVLKYDTKIDAVLDKLRGYTDTLNFFHISVSSGKNDDILRYLKSIQNDQSDLRLQYDRDSMKKWLAGLPRDGFIDACISKRAPGTCEWFFSTKAYSQWQGSEFDSPGPKVLWVHGPSGFGKTFISASIFSKIEITTPAAAVFWTSEKFGESSLDEIPRSWVAQLLTKNAINYEFVRPVWSATKGEQASAAEVWKCLKKILESTVSTTTLIIDGLDEYQHQQARRMNLTQVSHQQSLYYVSIQDFLTTLKNELRGTRCRFLCISQPDGEIRGELTSSKLIADGIDLIYEHSITQADMQPDVNALAKYIIERKLPNKDEKLKAELTELISQKAEGQMLWLALQSRDREYLKPSFTENKCRKMVEGTLVGLNPIYQTNLDRIQLDARNRVRTLRILNWILHSLRPLSVLELVEAILIDDYDDFEQFPDDELPGDANEMDVHEELQRLCGNFITFDIDEKRKESQYMKVRFIHSSVRVFLSERLSQFIRDSVPNQENGNIKDGNTLLASSCIRYLMCNNVWPPPSKSQDNFALTLPQHPLLAYAATYVPLHINKKNVIELEPLLSSFILDHYSNFDMWRQTASGTKDFAAAGLAARWPWDWPDRLAFAASLCLEAVCEVIYERDCVDVGSLNHALHAASWFGSANIARALLARGAQLDAPMIKISMLPLHLAASNGRKEVVELLLENGAEVNARHLVYGSTALHYAASKKHQDIVTLLLRYSADATVVDYNSKTVLYCAVAQKCKELVDLLLESEVLRSEIVHKATDSGWFPLLQAAENCDDAMVKCLLVRGANPLQLGSNGTTPLLQSAWKGHLKTFNLLLTSCPESSQFINRVTDKSGSSLLIWAVRGKNRDIIRILVEKGADVMQPDYNGYSAIDWTAYLGLSDILEYLLLQKQAGSTNTSDRTASLHQACAGGFKSVVQILVDQGCDLASRDSSNCTPLEHAAGNGSDDLVKMILAHPQGRKTINAICDDGYTPLLAACDQENFTTAEILLDHGADVTISRHGFGPLDHAASGGNVAFVEKLLTRYGESQFPEKSVLLMAAGSGDKKTFDLLRSRYPNNMNTTREGWTVLHCAAKGGNVEIVNDILAQSNTAMLQACTDADETALEIAVEFGQSDIAKLLLKEYANNVPPIKADVSTIVKSVECDDPELLTLFYQADPATFSKARDREGVSPLHRAFDGINLEAIEFLIGKKFDVLERSKSGWSCLHYFAQSGDYRIGKFLKDRDWKAGVSFRHEWGYTPLLVAAEYGFSDPFRKALKHGATLEEYVDNGHPLSDGLIQGYTSLHCAASSGNSEIVEQIIADRGVDCLEWRTYEGMLPIHAAASSDAAYMLEYLLDKGAKLDVSTYSGMSPLAFSIESPTALAFLLGRGAGAFEQATGTKLLADAAMNMDDSSLKLLLDHDFHFDKDDPEEHPLLHIAANVGSMKNIKLLRERGFEWTVEDSHGWTARDCLTLATRSKPHLEDEAKNFGTPNAPNSELKDAFSASWKHPTEWLINAEDPNFKTGDKATTAIMQTSVEQLDTINKSRSYVLTADHYLLPVPEASYFEVTITRCHSSNPLAVGCSAYVGSRDQSPYFSPFYLGDSGWCQWKPDRSDWYGPEYGQGDTIGCGVDYKAGIMFFTKNGKCLGAVSAEISLRLAPAILTREQDLELKGNFGQESYVFDISKHGYDNVLCKECYGKDGEAKCNLGSLPKFNE